LAREELMKEAKRGAERAREVGAFGYTCGHTELNMSNIDLIMSRAGNSQDNQK
jgi:hypothetical protein